MLTGFAGTGSEVSSIKSARMSFFLGGGYAHSESLSGMADVKGEFRIGITSRLKAGLSVGYLGDSSDMNMGENFNEMMGGSYEGSLQQEKILRVIPVTLSVYYVLPLNQKLDVFMIGGGGYYFGSLRDNTLQKKNAFGSHAGLGIDFRLSKRVSITAEGVYRFVGLNGFKSEMHSGFIEEMNGEQHQDGLWHYHHQEGEYYFHGLQEKTEQMMDSLSYNISLNGFSIRAGLRFNF